MTLRFIQKRPTLIFLLVLFALVLSAYTTYNNLKKDTPEPPLNPLYQNSAAPLEERVADLISHMTLEEKIGQMALVEKNSLDELTDISHDGLGGMLSGFGGKPENNTPEGWKEMIQMFTAQASASRLQIPLLYGVDAIHGHSNVPGATVFPHFIGLGATGDATLVEEVARATARELLATNVRWSYSPTLDMPEDIRWGRVYEAFSDDPVLVSRLGNAYLRGLQTSNSGTTLTPVLATPKHYLGAGGMLWNSSSNENFRLDQGTTPVDDEKLREHYLPPFAAAVENGAMSIMVGLNSWGDTKLAASNYLIQTILKDELDFEGFVVSDWYGVYEIPGGNYTAAVTAINAGVDMVMLPFDYQEFVKNVSRAVRNGDVEEARIDDAVARILRAKFQLGLFDTELDTNIEQVGNAEHRALARTAVAQSLVLLKDDNNLIPIRPNVQSVRVAGSAADNIGKQAGAWTVEWQGIDGNWLPGATSILAGLREVAPPGTVIEFEPNANFSTNAPKANMGIAVVGEAPYAEGWGDNPNPSLSSEDIATIERLRATSEHIIVILVTGRPLIVTDEIENWDAVIVAWLPGSEGAGVGDVLFGEKTFTGTLPLPWPAAVTQLPIVDGKTNDGRAPLFPRYFGL